MSSNIFSGIYRANDALTAARYGLDVTGQNIANANTPGYTRQASQQTSVETAVGVPTLHSGTVENGGVRAIGAQRLADLVLDSRMRDEHARSAQVGTQATRIADIENIFKEPSDNGLAEQLHDFWNAWGDVADDPGAQVPREMLIQSGQATVTMLHAMDSALDSVATASKNSLDAVVESANSAAKELSELNRKIAIGAATNTNVNALLDRRDVLLDQLSTAIGAKATLNANGTASVTVGGATLVATGPAQNGAPGLGGPPFTANALKVDGASPAFVMHITNGSGNYLDGTGAVADQNDPSTWATVAVPDSTASAELTTLNVTVPNYRAKLDAVAQALAKTVNGIQGVQADGVTATLAPGYDLTGTPGVAMFDNGSGSADVAGITAANISVAFTSAGDWKKIAASSVGDAATPAPNVDGGNALRAADSTKDPGSPDTAYSSLIGELGRASASAKQQQTTQSVITASVDTLQASTSGVSYDEEVSNMLTYQMAFQASSRVLTTLDSMLDTLINRTGLVGRA
jgi:flagellar hook-associated protein 1 FlgK